jgi:hypothetical protein
LARYAGRKGVVYLSATGSGTATQVVSLTSWSLDMTQDRLETTSFGDTNKTYVVGLRDVTGSFEGNYDDSETKIFTGAQSTDGVKLYLYPSSDAAGKYAGGPAWLDASINVGVNDVVTITGNFAANGSWTVNF